MHDSQRQMRITGEPPRNRFLVSKLFGQESEPILWQWNKVSLLLLEFQYTRIGTSSLSFIAFPALQKHDPLSSTTQRALMRDIWMKQIKAFVCNEMGCRKVYYEAVG